VIVILASLLDGSGMRGVGLWLLLLSAVLVREIGHGLAGAAAGYSVERLELMPIGSMPTEEESSTQHSRAERPIALAGPLANFAVGITMALLMYAATSQINLFTRPWVTAGHLLRSAIWAQILLGGLHLLPAYPLDAGVLLRRQLRRLRGDGPGMRATAGLSYAIALALIVAGSFMMNPWMLVMGCTLLLTGRTAATAQLGGGAAGDVKAGDVMLTEFFTLSGSDTLADALVRSVHSMQDVFPVVRGELVVGSIRRDALMQSLHAEGNGYVQSAMNRTVDTADVDEPLLKALDRVQRSGGAQLISVMRDDRVVGILTPNSLTQSMGALGAAKRMNRVFAAQDDE